MHGLEVNCAKCAAIPLMIFAIINLLNIFSLLNPIYWGGAEFLVPLLTLIAGSGSSRSSDSGAGGCSRRSSAGGLAARDACLLEL